jgi:hypothetical protein
VDYRALSDFSPINSALTEYWRQGGLQWHPGVAGEEVVRVLRGNTMGEYRLPFLTQTGGLYRRFVGIFPYRCQFTALSGKVKKEDIG